jgi:hypothetical protein
MEISEVFDEKIVRIGDILEQIASLNRRIAFHKQNNGNASTIKQYEEMREDFATELSNLLREYKLEISISVMPG